MNKLKQSSRHYSNIRELDTIVHLENSGNCCAVLTSFDGLERVFDLSLSNYSRSMLRSAKNNSVGGME